MVEITINDSIIELSDNASITLSSTLMTIGKIDSLSGEYSFSFDIPTTPRNNRILGFKNDLDTLNKFNVNYNVVINVDDTQIFQGSLLINSIDKENYKCNVFINKTNTLTDIFGESTLNEIEWDVDYKQDITINEENAKENPEVIYPLVSYGHFQREEVNGKYTSIFNIDETTKLYNENFLPAPNLLTLVRKCFESKGFTVEGDIFSDELLKKIYLSTNISDKQDFLYPYGQTQGDKAMGFISLNGTFKNYSSSVVQAPHLTYDLEDPQFPVRDTDEVKYNWTAVYSYNIFNILESNSENGQYGKWGPKYPDGNYTSMWAKNRIVIPTNGYYKVELNLGIKSNNASFAEYKHPNGSTSVTMQKWVKPDRNRPAELQDVEIGVNCDEMYMELHLLKNTDAAEYLAIAPHTYLEYITSPERYNRYSAYPHEKYSTRVESTEDNPYPGGYIPESGNTLNFDPSVNPNFVCGITKTGPYVYTSVAKNGRSWDSTCADMNKTKSNVSPYYGLKQSWPSSGGGTTRPGMQTTPEMTADYGANHLTNAAENTIETANTKFDSNIEMIMYFEKNDWLQLHMLTRAFDYPYAAGTSSRNTVSDAPVEFPFEVRVSAFSPADVPFESDEIFDWNKPSRFPKKLQINSFLNSETKISDFIENFIKTFNLSYNQANNTITINTQKKDNSKTSTIDLSNRYIDYDFEKIDYPYSIQVKFDINDEEYGYVNSVPDDKIDLPDWKSYADVGSEKIILNGMEGEDEVKSNFSYCWYKDFNVITDTVNDKVNIPIIAKDEWMLDGYDIAENMKHDGYSLKQRMFIKGDVNENITYGLYDINGSLQIKHLQLKNLTNDFELSFKKYSTDNNTILKRFFDTDYSTNVHYFNLTCYITANEYRLLKNGTNVIFNDNEYKVVEIEYSSDGECSLKLVSA